MITKGGSAAQRWACGILAALAAMGGLYLAVFDVIGAGGDKSWVAALGEAAARGDRFGRDIIFTGGPFSPLYTRYFDTINWPLVLIAGALLAVCLAWSCARLASSWLTTLLLPVMIFLASMDAVLFAFPALAAISIMIRPGASAVLVVLAGIAAAAICLAKFSIVPIAVVSFITIDAYLILQRRIPIGTFTFAASVSAWFVALGQNIRDLGDFLRFSLETSAGYVAAMDIPGSILELVAFLALASLSTAVIARGVERRLGFLAAVPFAAFVFVVFKFGFVRQDIHTITAWTGLALATAISTAVVRPSKLTASLLVGISIAATALTYAEVPDQLSNLRVHAKSISDGISNIYQIALHYPQWIERQRTAAQDAKASVRAMEPMPKLNGSVDTLPSFQSAVIAADLDYRPHFTVQDYTSYTRDLIDKDKQSWSGARAPDHILFGLAPIDNRFPALSEGPLWPELLRTYAPAEKFGDLVILDRREAPLQELLQEPAEKVIKLGERFALDADIPLFITIDVQSNWLARILGFVYRPPIVNLGLEFADGSKSTYRLIPAIAQAGFIISPLIITSDDFASLAMGMSRFIASQTPVAARIEVGVLGSLAYASDVKISIRAINMNIPRSNVPQGSQALRDEIAGLARILNGMPVHPPMIARIPEGLLAHAPSRFWIPLDNSKAATVVFGVRDGAWTDGRTDGACFRATTKGGKKLWERCLDPLHQPGDRGKQSATFALDRGQPGVFLETICPTDCRWAWSYWAAVIQQQ
jgi:hypothetical protein